MTARHPMDGFDRTCLNVRITSKEKGVTPLYPLWGTQQYYVDEVERATREDIHEVATLKGRQDGLSTVGVTLDVHYLNHIPGIQGEIIFDSDENRTYFRDIITQVVESIPKPLRRKTKSDNRAGLILEGPPGHPFAVSRLMYQVCSRDAAEMLGTGRGLNYLRCDEVAGYRGEDVGKAIDNLRAALSQTYPHRLYQYMSTPRGFNHFYDLWTDFSHSRFRRALFIGWWRNEHRAVAEGTLKFRVYGEPALSTDERFWVHRVKADYGWTITRAQLAWWRYTAEEVIKSEAGMYEAHPPIPELAWQATGSAYISPVAMQKLELKVREPAAEPIGYYTYRFGQDIEDTEVAPCEAERATLTMWEEPRDGATYVLGADPAYGSSAKADRSCCSVWRVVGHGLVQVAEFLSPSPVAYEFAWVIAHLCGAYARRPELPVVFTLEITGPGEGVYLELQRMSSYGWGLRDPGRDFQDAIANIRHYLWRRPDGVSGTSNSVHWKSTGSRKERMMSELRDMIERGLMGIRSRFLVAELRGLRQTGTNVEGHGRSHDDTCIAAGLAVQGFYQNVVPELPQDTEGIPLEIVEGLAPPTVLTETVRGFLAAMGKRQGVGA